MGERVGEFELVARIARGASGRVFPATQAALADRPVVLKITPLYDFVRCGATPGAERSGARDSGEHLSLARLQHTNIVPLYSVVDDPARRLHVMCMPYFGRATLASMLESLADVPLAARTGRHVVEAIDGMQDPGGLSPGGSAPGASLPSQPTAGAARQILGHVSYVQAVCWVTACLADALHFAHERDVVHLDLKPSDVLLAGDGQPMLLDFHLARAPLRPGGPVPDNFGGTPPYMPPEQHVAMRALREGRPVDVTVDGRADVYALGAMLYEALGGRLPVTSDSRPLARVNPQVSAGLSDVVARCVEARPEDRYPDALALGDDLRRHLTDQPLAGVRNRSVAERWRKWRRRRPGRLRAAGVLVLAAGVAATVAGVAWSSVRDRERRAELALADGERQLGGGLFAEAAQSFQRGLALAEALPFERKLAGQLRGQLAGARRGQLAAELHRLADATRVLVVADATPPGRLDALAARCDGFWRQREVIVGTLGGTLDPQVAADLQEVAIFAAGVRARVAVEGDPTGGRREALRLLDEAESLFGPNAVIAHERQVHRAAAGLPEAVAPARADELAPNPRTAWEHYALGRALLGAGDDRRAAAELAAAVRLDPAGRWPNFYFGVCAHRAARYDDAVAAFSVCVGAAPDVGGYCYNCGLAHAALGRTEPARRDYDRALALDPANAAAALNRGMLHFGERRFDEADADLRRALATGADAATVHYDLALVRVAAEDPAGAVRHVGLALQRDPAHEPAHGLRESLQRDARHRKTRH